AQLFTRQVPVVDPVEDGRVDVAKPALKRRAQCGPRASRPGQPDQQAFKRAGAKALDGLAGLRQARRTLHQLGPGRGVALYPEQIAVETFLQLLNGGAPGLWRDHAQKLLGVLLDGRFAELGLAREVV